jgi:hypothetical protein
MWISIELWLNNRFKVGPILLAFSLPVSDWCTQSLSYPV